MTKETLLAVCLKHTAISSYPEWFFTLYKDLLDTQSFNDFMRRVEEFVATIVNEDEVKQDEERDKLRGDALEVFAEIFFTLFPTDEGFGLVEYTPVSLEEDYGVDATGMNVNGHKVAVQVKYRGNPAAQIEYKELARTFSSAVCQLHLDDVAKEEYTLYLFTSGKGENSVCKKVFGKKLVVINRGIICHKTDNNVNFWRLAYKMMYNTLNE